MAKVKIQGHASGTGVLTISAPNTSTDRTITLPDATGTLATTADTTDLDGAITINESGADVDFRVESDDNANMLFVDGGEDRVGIGTGFPARTLHISDTTSGATTGIRLTGANNGSQVIEFADTDDTNVGYIQYDHGNNRISVRAGDANRLNIDSDGLKFGTDTAAANALDDYEEGSWNPAYTASAGSIGSTDYGEWEGYYTKIGRLVTCQFKVTLSNKGSWTSEVRLTGLPFSVQVTLPAVGSVRMANVDIPNDASNHDVYVTAGVTYFRIYYTQDDAASSFVQASQVENTSVFAGTMSYITVA